MSAETLVEFHNEDAEGSFYVLPEQGGDSAALATDFKDSLREAQQMPIQVIDFPEVVADACEREHSSLTQSCTDVLVDTVKDAPHTYFYTHDAGMANRIRPLVTTLISRTSIAESSAHQVFFAKLTDGEDSVRIAVKPFTKAPEKAVTDWTNTMLARTRGLHTFKPVGFIICDGTGYTVTERQDDIDPLDNVDWSRALLQPEQHVNMLEDILKVGPALARLNDAGIYHGDPQMKNGVLTQTGSMHWIDWESSTFIVESGLKQDFKSLALIQRKSVHDLRVLFSSLARPLEKQGVALLNNQTPATQLHYFRELILNPYIEERMKLMEGRGQENNETALALLGEIEADIVAYIENGTLYRTLQRSRHTNN